MSEPICLTRAQVREIDRLAVEAYGMPGVVLMENAGRAVADAVREAARPDDRIVILCGGGNNGGDGYVVARHLSNAGLHVSLYATKAPARLAGDAGVQATIATRMGLEAELITSPDEAVKAAAGWSDATVVVDALLGTGFAGEVRSPHAELINACNRIPEATIIAVDVPSGLDCDTGVPANTTVRADVTVTFVARKAGFERPEAKPWLGRVVVGDIGVPARLVKQVRGK